MLTQTIDRYLAVRRAAGFRLRTTEGFLRCYARFAAERGEVHVRAQTALDWAAFAPSASQRGRRLEALAIFAQHAQAEDRSTKFPLVMCLGASGFSTDRSSLRRTKFVNYWSRLHCYHQLAP